MRLFSPAALHQSSIDHYFRSSNPSTCSRSSIVRISGCGSANCKCCRMIATKAGFQSSVTGRYYKNNFGDSSFNCNTKDVVYLITCAHCNVQYVGETKQVVRGRMNQHRSGVKNAPKMDLPSQVHIYPHFNNGICNVEHLKFTILEQVLDATQRKQRELYWMKELRTVYPYGLNARESIKEKGLSINSIEKTFNPLVRKRTKRGSGKNPKPIITDPGKFFADWCTYAKSHHTALNWTSWRFGLRVMANSLGKRNLKCLGNWMQEVDTFSGTDAVVFDVLSDLLETRLFRLDNYAIKRDSPKFVWRIPFRNYGLNYLGLEKILRSKTLMNLVPANCDTETPTIVYSYEQPIRNKIFNYRKAVDGLRLDAWTKYKNLTTDCECHTSSYRDKDHGHVITGDLKIVRNATLRKMLRFGPNFRERSPIDWNVVKDCTMDTDQLISDWATTSNCEDKLFEPWVKKLQELVADRIDVLKNRRWPNINCFRLTKRLRTELKHLHSKYVIIPADKAANNVIVVCKNFYLNRCVTELMDTSSGTYMEVDETADVIMDRITAKLETFNIKDTDTKNRQLANLYWTAKMHKSPVGQRFIAASSKCITKVLSRNLTFCLKAIFRQHKKICRDSTDRRVNHMWIIDNSEPFRRCLHRCNILMLASGVDTFDFATLYTNIQHGDLKEAMKCIITEAYDDTKMKFLKLTSRSAYWTKKLKKDDLGFSCDRLIEMVNFLIDNIYVQCGDKVFKQNIGIPMGTDCAPYLANLFLYYYERRWLKTKDTDTQKLFNKCFRYIDDLCTLNNPSFATTWKEIYPKELQLKRTNSSSGHADFLDLTIKVNNGRFMLNIFDKRDDFGFDVVSFPNPASNIHFRRMHGVIIGQLIRFANGSTLGLHFLSKAKRLVRQLVSQGYSPRTLRVKCRSFCNNYPHLCRKLKLTTNYFINHCFEDGNR